MHTAPPNPSVKSGLAEEINTHERRWLAGLFLVLLGLRVLYACNMSFNSDEPQHLHVVWAWANGLLPYRDIFDNHTPLFHILCAPVFRLFGETAMILIYMRLAMIPLFAASLYFVMKIGGQLFSRRAGLWAAVFIGFAPFFFLKTVEFRTDDLWTAVWLGTVAIAVGGPPTARRMFCAGLALGAAFSVSMKTALLALALLLAGLIALVLWRRDGGPLRMGAVLRGLGAGLAGVLVVPAAIVAYFAAHHAIGALYYCVIEHNMVPSENHRLGIASRRFWFPAALALFIPAAHFIFRRAPNRTLAARRVLVLLTSGFFLSLLHSYWPKITSQDYPPVTPLLVILLTPAVLALADWLPARFPWLPRLGLVAALVVAELAATLHIVHPKERTQHYVEFLGRVLRFTDRGDYVMDGKSGAIFRRRPFYYALESVTRDRMSRNLIKDEIIADLLTTNTCMASDERLEGLDLAFVRANYLPFEYKMRIAGQHLKPDAVTGRAAFEIHIVTTYAIVTPAGPAVGTLDGQPYAGKVFLAAGPHEFVSEDPRAPHVLVWAQALERGFQPDFSTEHEKAKKIRR